MASLICPICGRAFEADHSTAMPFCSQRCREIDLGRWLGEKYTVPCPAKAWEEALPDSDSASANAAGDESSQ